MNLVNGVSCSKREGNEMALGMLQELKIIQVFIFCFVMQYLGVIKGKEIVLLLAELF